MPPTRYPGAIDHPITGRGGLTYVDAPWRLVLHSTVTKGLPNYTSPPHVTINPLTGTVWQHVDFDKGAYALLHPSGTPETNRMRALQVEIIDRDGDASEWNQSTYLAQMLQWFVREFPIQPTPHPVFSDSRCYGANSPCRMLDDEWLLFNGICGHQHVPHNRHWDPGELDIDQLLVIGGSPVTDHTHIPQAGVIHEWAADSWDEWVEYSGTHPDTRGWNFQREDMSWVYTRTIKPLDNRVSQLEQTSVDQAATISALQTQLAATNSALTALAERVSTLEDDSPSANVVSFGETVRLEKA